METFYMTVAVLGVLGVTSVLYWGYRFYEDGMIPPKFVRWQDQADVIHGRMFASRYTPAPLPITPSVRVRFNMPPPVTVSAPFGFPLTPVVNTPERLAQIDAIMASWNEHDAASVSAEHDALRAERDAL